MCARRRRAGRGAIGSDVPLHCGTVGCIALQYAFRLQYGKLHCITVPFGPICAARRRRAGRGAIGSGVPLHCSTIGCSALHYAFTFPYTRLHCITIPFGPVCAARCQRCRRRLTTRAGCIIPATSPTLESFDVKEALRSHMAVRTQDFHRPSAEFLRHRIRRDDLVDEAPLL